MHVTTTKRFSLFVVAFILAFGGSSVFGAEPGAFTRSAADEDLEWRPCPPFMPEGCAIALLNGDPAAPNADVFFRVPANSAIPSHWHTSAERMILVSGNMTVQYDGQEAVTLSSGAYAYGPPKLPHTAHCNDEGPCVLFIAFEDPVDAHATE